MKIILEGEEEVGSVNLDDFIRAHKAELAADVVVISDSAMFARGVPSICYGLRGLVYFQIDLRGSSTDLHSGSFGGAVANPAFVLAQMIAQMKDRGGRIKIPGFYDDVRPLQEEERKAWATLPFNEKKYRRTSASRSCSARPATRRSSGRGRGRRFEVNGLLSGFTGEGAKTVLPAVAMAKISMRLVPDQDPDKIADLFEAYVREDHAEDRRAEDHAHARRQAVDDRRSTTRSCRPPAAPSSGASDSKPVFTREGGSIPVVSTFQEELGLPSVLFGVGLPDENAHAPNEKLDLGNFHNGIIASAILYDEIAKR